MTTDGRHDATESPFPLRRYFFLGVLPALLILVGAVVLATTQTVRNATIELLLRLATQRVAGIAFDVSQAAPEAWQRLLGGETLDEADLEALGRIFADAQRGTYFAAIKIYGPDRRTLFATDPGAIGSIEDKPELRQALLEGEPAVRVEDDEGGGVFYELYLPYRSDGRVAAVFELYEPIADLDALLWQVTRPVLVIPILLFALIFAGLGWLVARAQRDIDRRTGLIIELRRRLERLVSRHAVKAMRADGRPRGETIEVTVFYSDVRGFTSFAETATPQAVIDFLNRVIGLQVEIVEGHGGDVDKMIGDAVMARFHGPDRARRAAEAALAAQRAVTGAGLPRGIGIGLYDGPVVAGLIGSGERLDFTVLGDSVNSAARLCGLAAEGEIIADNAVAAAAGGLPWGEERSVSVKGREAALRVRSLAPLSGAPR